MPYTPRQDNTHMFNMTDNKGCLPIVKYNDNSIMGILERNPDFSKFRYLVKLSKLQAQYNDPQANFTVFVPSDKTIAPLQDNWIVNTDLGYAVNIVRTSTVDRIISEDILQQSPAFYLLTKNMPNRLFITNISGKTKINDACVLGYIGCSNGLIVVVDKLVLPPYPGFAEQ